MKSHVTIRKLLCTSCLLLIFIVSNSFIYEAAPQNQTSPELTVSDQEPLEWIEDDEVSTSQERSDYGAVEADETFTLDDVMDAQESTENDTAANQIEKEQTGISDNSVEKLTVSTDISSFDKSDWKLVLINKQHSIPEDYEFTLGTIKGSMKCDERIIPELTELLQDAKADGVNLVICSPYRDYDRQIVLFNRKIKAYMKKKMSYMEAYRLTAQAVTVPGASEHQIGLALDIICDTYASLNDGFGDTEAGKWLAANSYKYGFILRYPLGKEDITGIEYEPWHFRYVGKDAAVYMYQNELTLEEFVSMIKE